MVSFQALLALAGVPLVLAQNYGTPSSKTPANAGSTTPTSTSSSTAGIHTVAVGQNGFSFTPDTITAKVGEQVKFEFFPVNHSVVQADFDNPCNPSKSAGIFSGFVPVTDAAVAQTFTIKINDTKPIWLYCGALKPTPHCAARMVAVINPPTSGPNTLDAFRNAAMKTNTSTVPASVNGGTIGSANSPPSSGSASSTASSTGAPQSTGAAASLMVGGGLMTGLTGLIAALFFL